MGGVSCAQLSGMRPMHTARRTCGIGLVCLGVVAALRAPESLALAICRDNGTEGASATSDSLARVSGLIARMAMLCLCLCARACACGSSIRRMLMFGASGF